MDTTPSHATRLQLGQLLRFDTGRAEGSLMLEAADGLEETGDRRLPDHLDKRIFRATEVFGPAA